MDAPQGGEVTVAPLKLDASLRLYEEARTRIPGASQTNSKRPSAFALGAYPIYARAARGSRITDVDGNEFLDLVSALGPISLGYGYQGVDAAIREQLDRGIIYGLLSPLEVEAARLLAELVPCAEQVRFFKGGGEATAAAARVARRHTGRTVILNCGYRGWPDIWSVQRNDGGIPKELAGTVDSFAFNDLVSLERKLAEHAGNVAAVFLDIAVTPPAAGFLAAAREMAHANGALFLMDEIVTGFRMANGGAQEYFGVTPDMACFAKGMANGMPLAAVVGRADVMEAFEDALISLTYGGEALSLAAAVATMQIYRDEPVIELLWQRGQALRDGLEQAARAAEIPFVTQGYAPMAGMAFLDLDPETDQRAWGFVLQEMAARRVLLRRRGLNFITYSHSEADIAQAVEAAREVFGELGDILHTPELAKRLRLVDVHESFRRY